MRYIVLITSETRVPATKHQKEYSWVRHSTLPAFNLDDARFLADQLSERHPDMRTKRTAEVAVQFQTRMKMVMVGIDQLESFFDDVRKAAMEVDSPQVSLSPGQDQDREFSEVHGDGRDAETRVSRNLAQIRGEA